MADNNSADVGRIRTYLAQHGGAVEDAAGRGLTDEMARAIGVDKPAALSAILGQMEDDGVITRDMRGLRTYRIALVADAAAPPRSDADEALVGGGRDSHRVTAYGTRTAELAPAAPSAPASDGGGAVRLRDALARRPKSAAPTTGGPEPVAASVTAPGAAAEAPPAEAPSATPARAVSLREALSQRTTAVVAPPERQAAPAAPLPGPAASDRPARAVSLRDAITGTDPSAAGPAEASPATGYVSSPRPAPAWSPGGDDTVAPVARPRKALRMPRLTITVPEVKTTPSTPIVTAVGIAMAGLVLVAVITIVVTRGSSHHVAAVGTVDSSTDACHVVTTDDATAAFGDPAGPPHFVLGSCVYDDGKNHELIVEVARQNARTLFDSSRSSSALDVPGIGESAYYSNGTLRVLKGSSLMLVTLSPFSPDKPSTRLAALAQSVQSRL